MRRLIGLIALLALILGAVWLTRSDFDLNQMRSDVEALLQGDEPTGPSGATVQPPSSTEPTASTTTDDASTPQQGEMTSSAESEPNPTEPSPAGDATPETPSAGRDTPTAETEISMVDAAGTGDAASETEPSVGVVPSFDLVRVEPSGATVIAGLAAPHATVEVLDGIEPVATAEANERGEWALALEEPLQPGTHDLAIRTTTADGAEATLSDERIAVAVPEDGGEEPLVVLNEPEAASRVLQLPAEPQQETEVAAVEPDAMQPETTDVEPESMPAEGPAVSAPPGSTPASSQPTSEGTTAETPAAQTEAMSEPEMPSEEPATSAAAAPPVTESASEESTVNPAAPAAGTTEMAAGEPKAEMQEPRAPSESSTVAMAPPDPSEPASEDVAAASESGELTATSEGPAAAPAALPDSLSEQMAGSPESSATAGETADKREPVMTPEPAPPQEQSEVVAVPAQSEPDETTTLSDMPASAEEETTSPPEPETVGPEISKEEPVVVAEAPPSEAPTSPEPSQEEMAAEPEVPVETEMAAVTETPADGAEMVAEPEVPVESETAATTEPPAADGEMTSRPEPEISSEPPGSSDGQEVAAAPPAGSTAAEARSAEMVNESDPPATEVTTSETDPTTAPAMPSAGSEVAAADTSSAPHSDSETFGAVAEATTDASEAVASPEPEAMAGSDTLSETDVAAAAPGVMEEPPAVAPNVGIAAIEADTNGALYIAGTATTLQSLRIYIDEEFVGDATPGVSGTWLLETTRELAPDEYQIRVDQVDASTGAVIARAEVPYQREIDVAVLKQTGESVRAGDAEVSGIIAGPMQVIIKRGDNLWRISREIYGKGIRYSTIYRANRDQIRNPNLIYPGQVFVLPSGNTEWQSQQ